MAITKRKAGGPYWVRFRIGGQDIFRSTGTTNRKQAEEFEQALRSHYWRQAKLGEEVHTWGEAVLRLKLESRWSANTRAANGRSFNRFAPIAQLPLAEIGRATVAEARSMLLRDELAPASINRHMAVFRQVLFAAVAWGWLKDAPAVEMLPVPERDSAALDADGFARLLLELPEHLRAPALLAATTGLRMANVRDLTWPQVHLVEGFILIPTSSSKTRRPIIVPLTPYSAALLASIERAQGTDRVFTYRPFLAGGEGRRADPRPITGTLNAKAFRKARKRAGVPARWHDLRHSFASWLAVAGAPDRILQQLGGWTSPAMLTRYAHLALGDTRSWASAVSANVVAGIEAVMPDLMMKAQEFQGLGWCRLTESNCGPHHYEGSGLSPSSNKNQALAGAGGVVDTGRNGPFGGVGGANVVARFPGPRRKP